MVYLPGRIFAIKLPSAADRTCFSTFDVPARNIATVASAIGLPPSSRTIPLMIPKLLVDDVPTGNGKSAIAVEAVTSRRMINLAKLLVRLKPIEYDVPEQYHKLTKTRLLFEYKVV